MEKQEKQLTFFSYHAVYAQLNFRNYYSESFIHVVNLLGKWPLAFRQLLANNCSINISGRKGCGIELDAFVEAEIVQPLKVYMSGMIHVFFVLLCVLNLYNFLILPHD